MIPQFVAEQTFKVDWDNIAKGMAIFVMGLFKKVAIADTLSPIVVALFNRVDGLTFLEAWTAVLGYTMQLYFDFSGYSEMAIGLGLMLNLRLPQNFASPYQSRSIIDFWRRWHMTLGLWVKNYLYSELKPSAKLELLPVNEEVRIGFIPEEQMEESGQWVDSMLTMEKSIAYGEEDINLYVSLNSDNAADTFIIMNMLDILVSMPGSGVRLKKIFTVRSRQRSLTGLIRDDTDGYGVTELIHATRAFLNYGRADMIVDIWKKSGEQNESIARMIYAMRHVDDGLSMCNIPEVEEGILRLRELFRAEKTWREIGYYGMLFGVIAESIREDYGVLLEGDGSIPFIDLVKWAYRHRFYQQTLTLIESKAPEVLVKSGMFYYCSDEKNREQVTQLFAKQRQGLKPYEYYKIDNVDHYFIKTYDRGATRGMGNRGEDPQRVYAAMRSRSVGNEDSSKITGYTACDSMETLQNLLFAYYHIGVVRNKINHAEADAMTDTRLIVSESDESAALVWMKESIDYFISSYEKAVSEVKDKNPQVVLITGDEVRKAAERMKYEKRS